MSKILINASILSEKNTGLGVYTRQIIEHVCPLLIKDGISVDVLCKSSKLLPENYQGNVVEINSKGMIGRLIGPELLNLKKYDLIWSTTQHGMTRYRERQIITIHDITPVLYPEGRIHQYIYYKTAVPYLIRKCRGVIAVSENTAADIAHLYPIAARKRIIKVIKESIEEEGGDTPQSSKASATKNYFTITGIHYPYKNIDLVINAYIENPELRQWKTLIIGGNDNSYGRYLKEKVRKNNLESCILFTGFISNKERDELLNNSLASIFPSKYEGFGLPLLEAMKMKTPVLCARASSFPEVAGDAAMYFDMNNPSELKEAMVKIANDEGIRAELIERGTKNLAKYSWSRISEEMRAYIECHLPVK